MQQHRHVNPDGSLGGLTSEDLSPDMWLLHEDEIEPILDKLGWTSTATQTESDNKKVRRALTSQEHNEILQRCKLRNFWHGGGFSKIQPMTQPSGLMFYLEYVQHVGVR